MTKKRNRERFVSGGKEVDAKNLTEEQKVTIAYLRETTHQMMEMLKIAFGEDKDYTIVANYKDDSDKPPMFVTSHPCPACIIERIVAFGIDNKLKHEDGSGIMDVTREAKH